MASALTRVLVHCAQSAACTPQTDLLVYSWRLGRAWRLGKSSPSLRKVITSSGANLAKAWQTCWTDGALLTWHFELGKPNFGRQQLALKCRQQITLLKMQCRYGCTWLLGNTGNGNTSASASPATTSRLGVAGNSGTGNIGLFNSWHRQSASAIRAPEIPGIGNSLDTSYNTGIGKYGPSQHGFFQRRHRQHFGIGNTGNRQHGRISTSSFNTGATSTRAAPTPGFNPGNLTERNTGNVNTGGFNLATTATASGEATTRGLIGFSGTLTIPC